jgi:hypothetical protein
MTPSGEKAAALMALEHTVHRASGLLLLDLG